MDKVKFLFVLAFIFVILSPAGAEVGIDEATRQVDQPMAEEIEKRIKEVPTKPTPIEREEPPVREEVQRFFIKKIILEGVESFPPEEFASIVGKYENKETSLEELRILAKEIEEEYLRRGIIAAVFIPPQEVKEGSIILQVIEARMGDLEIQEHNYFKKDRLNYYWKIPSGEILRYQKISKSLNLMNKNPDREVKATLRAGKRPGTTDVLLTTKTFFPIHLQFPFDREGVAITGKKKPGFSFRHNNLFGLDDILLAGSTFTEDSLGLYTYHNIPITNFGTNLFYGFSRSRSSPKKEFEIYDLESIAENTFLSISQDIFREGEYKGDISLGIDFKDKVTRMNTGTYRRDRLRVINLRSNLRWEGFAGVGTFSPEISQGIDTFGARMDEPFASRNAKATFTKLNLNIRHTRRLPFGIRRILTLKGQLSSSKLAPQEEFSLGGMDSVRGYPPSDYLADNAVLANYELRTPNFLLPKEWRIPYLRKSLKEQTELVFFIDYGYGRLRGPMAREKSSRRLIGVGSGLAINPVDQVSMRLEWGFPLGDDPLTEKADSRFHFSFSVDLCEKMGEEIEYIKKTLEEKRIRRWAWNLVNEELARFDSPVRKKLYKYVSLAQNFYQQAMLQEAKELYEKIAQIGRYLYQQGEEYVRNCISHEAELKKRNRLALEYYKEGKLKEAKELWQRNIDEAKPRPLVFEF